jgi:hypothetical protein
MLSGKRAFKGGSSVETIDAILKEDRLELTDGESTYATWLATRDAPLSWIKIRGFKNATVIAMIMRRLQWSRKSESLHCCAVWRACWCGLVCPFL